MPINMMRHFFKLEAAGGILLGAAAILALFIKNSSFDVFYDAFLTLPIAIQFGDFAINKPLLLWVNDGLMAIFFFLIGLEIKREILEGQLSTRKQISLPAIAALGGLICPALIYSYINWDGGVAMRGWAIPAATDIAFALGVITLLGKRVPETLKIALVAIAIIDDLAAIVIIALFYTESIALMPLILGLAALIILAILNKRGVTKITPYIIVGIFLWVCVLKSGVHATLAGVVLALFIPLRDKTPTGNAPLLTLEHGLHGWVAYCILPIFAFANAGVSLQHINIDLLLQPITLGIILGLVFGKQIGVILFTRLGIAFNLCQIPTGVTWAQYYGMCLITGIGFTMSLFIGSLAFSDADSQNAVRLGVLAGSAISGILGYMVLRLNAPKHTIST